MLWNPLTGATKQEFATKVQAEGEEHNSRTNHVKQRKES